MSLTTLFGRAHLFVGWKLRWKEFLLNTRLKTGIKSLPACTRTPPSLMNTRVGSYVHLVFPDMCSVNQVYLSSQEKANQRILYWCLRYKNTSLVRRDLDLFCQCFKWIKPSLSESSFCGLESLQNRGWISINTYCLFVSAFKSLLNTIYYYYIYFFFLLFSFSCIFINRW
jgi:hypothetical protein